MCDGITEVEPEPMIGRRFADKAKSCVKCSSRNVNIGIKHSAYCIQCFDIQIATKFRRALTQSLNLAPRSQYSLPKPTQAVLISVSSGVETALLLDLVEKECFPRISSSPSSPKPLTKLQQSWTRYYLAYVEVCAAIPGREDQTGIVRDAINRLGGRDLTVLRLEDAFDHSWWSSMQEVPEDGVETIQENEVPPRERLVQFLRSLPTPSAISSMINQLLRLLLLHTAKRLNCSHLLLGDSLTSLSVSLISSVVSGDGFHIASEREEVWRSIRVVKPLRDITSKECAAAFHWRQLRMIGAASIEQPYLGIRRVTRDFIVALDQNFPSTVNTIAKTCAKLTPKDEADAICWLCQRPTTLPSHNRTAGLPQPAVAVGVNSMPISSRLLCYACHAAFSSGAARSSGGSITTLPVWTNHDALLVSTGN